MIYELKRIRLRTLFKISFAFYALLGCVFGLAFVDVASLIGFLHNPPDLVSFIRLPSALQGYLGVFIILASSLAYGLVGAAFISVGAIIYNVFSSLIGGVKFELSESEKKE